MAFVPHKAHSHSPVDFGRPFQVAVVVQDLEGTMEFLEETFGLGPWLSFDSRIVDCTVRGNETEVVLKAGIWFGGDIQLELLQIISGETIHKEYHGRTGQGLHHLAFETSNFEETLAALTARGVGILQKGTDIPSVPLPFRLEHAYMETTDCGGLIFEIAKQELFRTIDVQLRVGHGNLLRVGAWTRKWLCWIPALRVWRGESLGDRFTSKSKGLRLGKIAQVGAFVNDLDNTIHCLQNTFGIGPWLKTGDGTHTAIAYAGPIQLELVEKRARDTARVCYPGDRDEGLHHLGFIVNDLDDKIRVCRTEGIHVGERGVHNLLEVTGNYAYLDLTQRCGLQIKLIQYTFRDGKAGNHGRFRERIMERFSDKEGEAP